MIHDAFTHGMAFGAGVIVGALATIALGALIGAHIYRTFLQGPAS